MGRAVAKRPKLMEPEVASYPLSKGFHDGVKAYFWPKNIIEQHSFALRLLPFVFHYRSVTIN
jgi:hypothetical protein